MPKDYFAKCRDCGYLWPDAVPSLTGSVSSRSASFKCRHCGGHNSRIIPQQDGRFGCIGNPPQP